MKRPKRSGAAGRSAHLLDTSTLLWALAEPERLSARVRRLVAAGENRATELTSARVRNIRPAHITALAALPMLHKDPFDRILIAQAKAEGLGLLTNDRPSFRTRVGESLATIEQHSTPYTPDCH